jgi:DNA repair exonuclease SbcCD ATPase subunit
LNDKLVVLSNEIAEHIASSPFGNEVDIQSLRVSIDGLWAKIVDARAEYLVAENDSNTLESLSHAKTTSTAADDESCPTCDQILPLNRSGIESKAKAAAVTARIRKDELVVLEEELSRYTSLLSEALDFERDDNVRTELFQKRDEIKLQLSAIESLTNAQRPGDDETEVIHLQHVLNNAESELLEMESLYNNCEVALASARGALSSLTDQYKQVHNVQQLISANEDSLRVSVDAIKSLEIRREELYKEKYLLQSLSMIFGPKGIQQYMFLKAVRSLEEAANSYLEVLAEGGIQIKLDGTDNYDMLWSLGSSSSNSSTSSTTSTTSTSKAVSGIESTGDKISKSALIRGEDGRWRERSLQQLSGGQWRRISLAMDLAFVEALRRRGTMRCSLLVMDETLTHLDASGRASVGQLLHNLAKPPAGSSESHNEGGGLSGAFSTVLVILQDLAATELEESFDNIDTIVKRGDVARVKIDGGDDLN